MKNKIVAVVIALLGFGALAALPAASARTGNWKACPSGQKRVDDSCRCPTGLTKSGDSCVCPSGQKRVGDSCYCPTGTSKVGDYCECPQGTSRVGDYCEPSGGVKPQGPPTVDDWFLWGAKGTPGRGPALKFNLQKGINGAPGIKQFTLILPDGLTFGANSKLVLVKRLKSLKMTKTTLTVTLEPRPGQGSHLPDEPRAD